MHVLIVTIHVRPAFRDAFIEATLDNVRNSHEEPGVVRFDFLQNADDPNRFALYEVYHSPDDHAAHRETAHYARWRDAVTDWMADTRIGSKYVNLFPADAAWQKQQPS